MARRPRVFAPGLLYHVIVRGNQRRKTVRCNDDYKAYLHRLEHYRAEFHLRIYAYCPMLNDAGRFPRNEPRRLQNWSVNRVTT